MRGWTQADIDAYKRRAPMVKPGPVQATVAAVPDGITEPHREYRFHPSRRWRFDYAWPSRMIALEIEGGVWTGGRHTRGAGFLGDMEKYNAATLMGWKVLRCVPGDEAGWVARINGMEVRG